MHEDFYKSFENRTKIEYPKYEYGYFCGDYAGSSTGCPWDYLSVQAGISRSRVYVSGAVYECGVYHIYLCRRPYGSAIVVSEYRERKILKRFQVTPVSPVMLLVVEFTIYVLYALVSMVLLFPAAACFWGVAFRGSWPAFIGSWFLTLISTLSIGMMVGGIAKDTKIASVIASILYFPMLIFSGATVPFEVMPKMLQKIVGLFPLTQGIQLMKAASLGLAVDNLWLPVAVMGAVAIVCTGIAVKCFQWE